MRKRVCFLFGVFKYRVLGEKIPTCGTSKLWFITLHWYFPLQYVGILPQDRQFYIIYTSDRNKISRFNIVRAQVQHQVTDSWWKLLVIFQGSKNDKTNYQHLNWDFMVTAENTENVAMNYNTWVKCLIWIRSTSLACINSQLSHFLTLKKADEGLERFSISYSSTHFHQGVNFTLTDKPERNTKRRIYNICTIASLTKLITL